MDANLNSLKRHIFFELLNLAGRVFVVVRYSDNVILGNRGFTQEERENGIILVFNSRMNFLWDDYGITATLVFGTSPQKCFIPVEEIVAIYSPELNAHFVAPPRPSSINKPQHIGGRRQGESPVEQIESKREQERQKDKKQGHVIKVDFNKKTKIDTTGGFA